MTVSVIRMEQGGAGNNGNTPSAGNPADPAVTRLVRFGYSISDMSSAVLNASESLDARTFTAWCRLFTRLAGGPDVAPVPPKDDVSCTSISGTVQ